eukprot:6189513-Pleurochrysis_carterae.AAC.2
MEKLPRISGEQEQPCSRRLKSRLTGKEQVQEDSRSEKINASSNEMIGKKQPPSCFSETFRAASQS